MTLAGKRVLVVEDEMLVAMTLEDTLIDLGLVVVGVAMHLEEALERASHERLDVAVLDINLNGERSYPVADMLQARGIPFIFASGYGHTDRGTAFPDTPTLAKPYHPDELAQALTQTLAQTVAPDRRS
ncbi:CheY-like chemotaxis protein [Rhizobium sp. PP-F2F-G48]|uniref:response regulator n=1 Tax=Rhizobium sp. PP-F2F-G48 TaxID=2135651 RepID=UPI0010E4AC1E|nr:response regulator [Rhizobium sp. PP-F2F-G48]TCM50798.1 CheY-like chemotaxis protein [Rhizobium sp. PP-F2F-G48]